MYAHVEWLEGNVEVDVDAPSLASYDVGSVLTLIQCMQIYEGRTGGDR